MNPRKLCALGLGLVTHATFLVAITVMVLSLWGGMSLGLGRLEGAWALGANLALALQFPLLHSLMLSAPGRRLLARIDRDLVSTSYALFASLQLLTTFLLWSPSGIVWWQPTGAWTWLWVGLFAGSWLFLGVAILHGGLALQTGALGWLAVVRGRRPEYGPLRTQGLFALCRQPIYLGFMLTLWTGAVSTPDRWLLALIWSLYCVFGPRLKERRFLRIHGDAFVAYTQRVPYLLPLPRIT